MGSEYFINNQDLEDKVRELLPSQGGAGAGFDLSASTQIIPIIDLTESAEGSNVRQDLQTSLSFTSVTAFNVENTTTTLINNTGYFRVFGNVIGAGGSAGTINLDLSDGTSTKRIFRSEEPDITGQLLDFIVFLSAGDSLSCVSSASNISFVGCTRQLADISGNLVNPL